MTDSTILGLETKHIVGLSSRKIVLRSSRLLLLIRCCLQLFARLSLKKQINRLQVPGSLQCKQRNHNFFRCCRTEFPSDFEPGHLRMSRPTQNGTKVTPPGFLSSCKISTRSKIWVTCLRKQENPRWPNRYY